MAQFTKEQLKAAKALQQDFRSGGGDPRSRGSASRGGGGGRPPLGAGDARSSSTSLQTASGSITPPTKRTVSHASTAAKLLGPARGLSVSSGGMTDPAAPNISISIAAQRSQGLRPTSSIPALPARQITNNVSKPNPAPTPTASGSTSLGRGTQGLTNGASAEARAIQNGQGPGNVIQPASLPPTTAKSHHVQPRPASSRPGASSSVQTPALRQGPTIPSTQPKVGLNPRASDYEPINTPCSSNIHNGVYAREESSASFQPCKSDFATSKIPSQASKNPVWSAVNQHSLPTFTNQARAANAIVEVEISDGETTKVDTSAPIEWYWNSDEPPKPRVDMREPSPEIDPRLFPAGELFQETTDDVQSHVEPGVVEYYQSPNNPWAGTPLDPDLPPAGHDTEGDAIMDDGDAPKCTCNKVDTTTKGLGKSRFAAVTSAIVINENRFTGACPVHYKDSQYADSGRTSRNPSLSAQTPKGNSAESFRASSGGFGRGGTSGVQFL